MDKSFEIYVKQGWSDEKYEAKLRDQKVKECIGKRVVGIMEYDGVDLKGMKGTIVDVIEMGFQVQFASKQVHPTVLKSIHGKRLGESTLAVRWDEYNRQFHTLQGRVPRGYGYWVNLNVVKILDEDEEENIECVVKSAIK